MIFDFCSGMLICRGHPFSFPYPLKFIFSALCGRLSFTCLLHPHPFVCSELSFLVLVDFHEAERKRNNNYGRHAWFDKDDE